MSIKFLTPVPQRTGWRWLLGLLIVLALNSVPSALAFPPPPANANINGTDCDLIDAITAANTDTATGLCAAGTPGADTIELLDNVTLTAENNNQNGLPQITSEITINGNGFTIARDPGAGQFRILTVEPNGNLTLNAMTITGGSRLSGAGSGAGAGIYNFGALTLNNSTISGNSGIYGGGISNGTNGTLTLTNSTVSGNSANAGGGIYNFGTGTLNSSTVSGNSANSSGGGIQNDGLLTLERSLISGNSSASSGSEIYNWTGFPPFSPPGIVNSDNFNLFGHSGKSNAQAIYNATPGASDITATSDGTNPAALASILITTLQVNAPGNTATHALLSGSPAVDAAPSGPATDQRGVARPQGCAFDIGAFELEATCNTPPVANNDSYSTPEDATLSVAAPGVLGNDSDAESDPLTAVLVSGPSKGSLTLNADGSFSYTPATNFSGSDSFTYKANDSQADSNVATVNITVVSAADQITQLKADVQVLVDGGALSSSHGQALSNKLDSAQKQLAKGNINDAINKLQAFISQVNDFIANGELTPAQGQPLIDAANAIINSLN